MVSFRGSTDFGLGAVISFILGGALIVSVFLPWFSSSIGGGMENMPEQLKFSYSVSGFAINVGLGIVGVIAGIGAIMAVFIRESKIRGGIHLAMGLLAILTFLGVWSSSPNLQLQLPGGNSGAQEMNQILSDMFGLAVGPGFYMYLTPSVLFVISGLALLSAGKNN